MASKRNAWVSRIAIAVVVVAAAVAYFAVPSVNSFVNDLCRRFSTGDFAEMRDFMASYGAWAAVVSFALMIFQSVAAPLPAFILTFANANLFGWWQGAILSWTSAMAGAAACFWIARSLGREAVEKLCSKTGLATIERFFERYGGQSVLIARLLPFVSFDFVSYFAGLTSMSFKGFMIATGIGQLPAAIVYSYVGGMLAGGAKMLFTALLILFALAALAVLTRQLYREHASRQGGGQTRRRCSDSLAGSVRVVHALSALMGVDETPAVSTTVLNRAKAASEGAFVCGSTFFKRYFLPQLGHRSARKHSSHFGRRAMHVSRPKSTH